MMRSSLHVAALILALALSGCGGGEEPPPSSGPPPSTPSPPSPPPVTPNRPPVVTGTPIGSPIRINQFHDPGFDARNAGFTVSDPDGDALGYLLAWNGQPPQGLAISGTRLTGAPEATGSFLMQLWVSDGRGGVVDIAFWFEVVANAVPTIVRPNGLVLVSPNGPVNHDVSQGGTTAADTENDLLNYSVQLSAERHGLSVSGQRVVGTFSGTGAVRVTVTASDPFGATATEVFNIVAPAALPGRPVLPQVSNVYDDFQLPLPDAYVKSPNLVAPFWDTTPATNPTTNAGATLGRVLFYDKRLSSTNTHSCGSCHEQQHGFANASPVSVGATGEAGRRNAMGLTNARYNLRDTYFVDSRARTLEGLALMPISDQTELANTLPNAIAKLAAEDFYPPLFQAAFGSPEITSQRIALALAQFVRSLISYRARMDQVYPDGSGVSFPGQSPLMTPLENEGVVVFVNSRCGFCHSSRVFTSADTSNNGLDEVQADPGGFGGAFRVASLRNIRSSAPYMHDGRFATLREVIDHYDSGIKMSGNLAGLLRTQNQQEPLRLNLTEREKQALEAFLDTLTDEAMLSDPKFSDPFDSP
jgi:cytochrome c peroxidase